MDLQGRVAIVTGSGRGIGAATARLFAKQGAKVVLNYLHNEEAAKALLQEIVHAGGTATVVQADVMTEAGAVQLAKQALATYGAIDILVSNAASTFGAIPLEQMSWDVFSDVLNRDLKATFYTTKAVIPAMVEQRAGRIVYIGSASAVHPTPGLAHHGSARAAITMFARYVAKELGPKGITANVVAPGMVETDRTAGLTDMKARLSAMTPVKRIATPDDVARAVAFFAADVAGFYTGTYFPVDGGLGLG